MMKLRMMGAVLITTVVLLGSMGTIVADDEATPTPDPIAEVAGAEDKEAEAQYQGLVGTVGEGSDIDGGIIRLATKARGEVDVALREETVYKVPGQAEASRADVVVGSRVAILATRGENQQYNAVRVMVIPGKATRRHFAGVVVSVDDRTMTITNAEGESLTVEIPEGLKGGAVGSFISAVVRRFPGKERPVATGSQTAEQVKARIEAHLDEVAARRADKEAEKAERGKDIEKLSTRLERLAQKHQEVLTRVLEKVQTDKARDAIQKAIDNSAKGLEKARSAIRQAKGAGKDGKSGSTPAPDGRAR